MFTTSFCSYLGIMLVLDMILWKIDKRVGINICVCVCKLFIFMDSNIYVDLLYTYVGSQRFHYSACNVEIQ